MGSSTPVVCQVSNADRFSSIKPLPPVALNYLAQCQMYHGMSRRSVVIPGGFVSGRSPRKTYAMAYAVPRVASTPATGSHENFKQVFEGFLALTVPQIVSTGTSGVEQMLTCERVELTQSYLRVSGSPNAHTTGAHALHPLPRRVSVHLVIPPDDTSDNRMMLDAFTAAAVCGSDNGTAQNTNRPINTMRFTATAGAEAEMLMQHYTSSVRAFDRTSLDVLRGGGGSGAIIILVWAQRSSPSSDSGAIDMSFACNRVDLAGHASEIHLMANTLRQCMTCLAVECDVPIPIGMVCPPIMCRLDVDFYRATYVEVTNRFAALCTMPAQQPIGPIVESNTLGSTSLYMRMTPRRAAEQDAHSHSLAYNKQYTVDQMLCEVKCCAHFVPAIMLCIEGKQDAAIDFCLHPRHARPGLPEPSIQQDKLGLVLATVEHESRDVSSQISLYGWRGIPGRKIFADSEQSKIGIIGHKQVTYTAEFHASWCVQPCASCDDLLPSKNDMFIESSRKCIAMINSVALGASLSNSTVSPCMRRSSDFDDAAMATSMAEDYCISEWGTHEYTNLGGLNQATRDEATEPDSGMCGFLGISAMSDKTSIGDAMALSYAMNGHGDVAKGLCLSLAAAYGIGTSVKKCMENVSGLLGRPSKHAIEDITERKRSVSVAVGSLDVGIHSHKRRSPVLFETASCSIARTSIRMTDVLRALNVVCRDDQTEMIQRHSNENDHARRASYLRAVSWGFHKIGMQQLHRLDQTRSGNTGTGVGRVTVSMNFQLMKLRELETKMDRVAEALERVDDLPADPTLAIALVYRMCLDVGMDLTPNPKFIIFSGDGRARTFHRLSDNATLEDATLDDIMSHTTRRLLIASATNTERAHTKEISIPVSCSV